MALSQTLTNTFCFFSTTLMHFRSKNREGGESSAKWQLQISLLQLKHWNTRKTMSSNFVRMLAKSQRFTTTKQTLNQERKLQNGKKILWHFYSPLSHPHPWSGTTTDDGSVCSQCGTLSPHSGRNREALHHESSCMSVLTCILSICTIDTRHPTFFHLAQNSSWKSGGHSSETRQDELTNHRYLG